MFYGGIMKRYDLYKRSIHDRSSMAVRKEGLWVKYEDIKEFLPDAQKKHITSDYAKCCCCIQSQYLISVHDWSFCPKCGNRL